MIESKKSQQKHHQTKQLTINLPKDILKYNNKNKELREKFLKSKTMQQLRTTTHEQKRAQFYCIRSSDTSNQLFCKINDECNRFIYPYKHSQVRVQEVRNYHTNANYVRSVVDQKVFAIFGQAPLKEYDSFWEGVYFNETRLVVMLSQFYDYYHHSEGYWPEKGKQQTFSKGDIRVKNISSKEIFPDVQETIFEINGIKGKKQVKHLKWTGWEDLGQPTDRDYQILKLLLKQSINEIIDGKIPWIHCNAGVGRTGTFGAIIQAIRSLNKNKKVSVFQIVENLRKYRCSAVETSGQYQFIYQYLGSLVL